jgi:diacylglycerol O-acyltransferase-1
MQTIESLRNEKATLEKELQRITSKIEEHSGHSEPSSRKSVIPASKSGYLFKWQDRSIGWGGTKWALRFVRLEKGRLGYYKTHDDTAPRYLLTLKNCAIRDDGSKPNKRFRPKDKDNEAEVKESKPGAYFHVFSIYQRPKGADSTAELDEEDNIVPLLRFSTTSLAEKAQWMDLLVESCAYCNSDEFDDSGISPLAVQTASLPISEHGTHEHTRGTLPLLNFAPRPVKIGRTPSNAMLKKTASHLKLNKNKDSAKSNSKKKNDYPPSKPMHRRTEASYLSHEAPTLQNYRGLLNLGLIILVISNFRILLGSMREYGFVVTYGFFSGSEEEYAFTWKDIVDVPFVGGMVMLNFFVIFAYLIEFGTSRKVWNEMLGISLHVVNTNVALFLPMMIVWDHIESPVNGAVLLMTASVLWMKLISYVHANADYRRFPERNNENITAFIQNTDGYSTTLSYPRCVQYELSTQNVFCPISLKSIVQFVKKTDIYTCFFYNSNVTISNLYYFWFAPTLTYQIVFPKLARRNMQQIFTLVLRLCLCFVLLVFLVAQVIRPVLNEMMKELQDEERDMLSIHIFAEYLLKLSIASSYIWLLVFYGFFHVLLNLLAQLLRFGDRVFYRDWWNSSNLSSYWRLWNLPVHYWLVRHLYYPCIRRGMNKSAAMFIVFFFSAVLHEMLISVSLFHSILNFRIQTPIYNSSFHLHFLKTT